MADQTANNPTSSATTAAGREQAIHGLVDKTLQRLGFSASEVGQAHLAVLRDRFCRVLEHHQAAFAEASKHSDAEYVAAALATGEFAAGRRDDVNLWDDVALAMLLAQGQERAVELFRARFAANIRGWEQRYSRRQPYSFEDFVADLLLPREQAGPRLETYKGHGPLDGWLRQVYLSICEKRRTRAAAAPIPCGLSPDIDDGAAPRPAACCLADGESPDERYARLECAEKLAPLITECVGGLDEELRLVLMLAVVDEVPQKQIAGMLQWPEYKVTRVKQKAIRASAESFMQIAKRRAALASESVRECIALLLERFPVT